MTLALLLALLPADPSRVATAPPDPEVLLERGRSAFTAGVAQRGDSAKARVQFAEAARAFDAVREARGSTPELALARGRAHALAGDLPAAIVALHEGLRQSPAHAELQRMLEQCRDRVLGPAINNPDEAIRPPRTQGWRTWASPWDVVWLGALFGLLLVAGLARRFTVRDGWAWGLIAVGGLGLALAGLLDRQLHREAERELVQPLRVIRASVVLRRGNGESYPARIDGRLPPGVEVRELAQRGDWVQVQLAGGAAGWLPEADTLRVR